jgi:hypothetical protein
VKRALYLFDQLCDIVQSKPWSQVPEIADARLESLPGRGDASIRQAASQGFVDNVAEGPPSAARFRLELGRHIVVQGESGSHILMLQARHHDVNKRPCY